jgi:hypothetical protein
MWRLVALAPTLAACDLVFTVEVAQPQPGCLFDDFDQPEIDPAKWNDVPPSRIAMTHADGRIAFSMPESSALSTIEYGYLLSGRLFDVTGRFFEAELVQPPDPTAGAYIGIVLGIDTGSFVELAVGAGGIVGSSYFPYAPFVEYTPLEAFDPVQHRVLRMTGAADVITFQAFDAAGVVTFEATLPTRISLQALVVELAGSTYDNAVPTEGALDNVLVDGVNCPLSQ